MPMSIKNDNGYIKYILQTPDSPSNSKNLNLKGFGKMFSKNSKRKLQLSTPESLASSRSADFDKLFSSPISSFGWSEEFSESDSFNSTRPLDKRSQFRMSRFNFRDLNCNFCDEPLLNILENENPPIVLTCSHKCHEECYLMVLDKRDLSLLPTCPICGFETGCEDKEVEENMTRKLLLKDDDEVLTFDEDEICSPIGNDSAQLPMINYENPKTPEGQIISNASQWSSDNSSEATSINDSMLSFITSPKVSFLPEVSKLNLSLPDNQQFVPLKCFLTVQGPSYHLYPGSNKEDVKFLIDEMMHKLNEEVQDWKGINLADLGELVCFDFLQVGTNDEEFVEVRCFLFEKILLILNKEGDQIEGTILMSQICSCLETDNGMIQLNLKTELLPLAYLSNNNKIILKKWFHLISKIQLLKQDEDFKFDDNQLIQLSTNAWSLIEKNKSSVPFTKPSLKVYELTIPKPAPLPVSVVLCISLINTTEVSNEQYLQYLKQITKNILSSLSDCDSFGLVTIGKNPVTGEFLPNGSFTGTASPSWDEWDEVVENLSVYKGTVFNDEYDMLYHSLLHSIELISSNMEFRDSKRIKKLIMISNPQQVEIKDDVPPFVKEMRIRDLLSIISRQYSLQLDSFLIGKNFSLKYLYYISNSLKINTVDDGFYQVTLGSNFKRFEDYQSLISEITSCIKELEEVVIPKLEITITTESLQEILVSSIENPTNGEMIPLTSNFDQIKLSVFNLKINESKTILINLAVDKTQLLGNSFKDVRLATIQGSWFNTLFETVPEASSIRVALSHQRLKYPPAADLQSIFSDITQDTTTELVPLPLLPPLISSQREILYIKREVELLFLQSLITTIESFNLTHILETISLIWGILKSCNGDSLVTVSCKCIRLKSYVEDLCERGREILEMLQDDSTRDEAVMKGYDLCFKIGLQ